jgi:predicted amidophosphoribosyltransferase
MKPLDWLISGLFPLKCFVCQQEGQRLCRDCFPAFVCPPVKAVCPFCHAPDDEGKTCGACRDQTFLDGATSPGLYREPILRGLLQSWKFSCDQAAGQLLKEWLARFPLSQILPPVDWYVTAIPLHSARQRERGFNQAEEIARTAGEIINCEYFDFLRRREWTAPQARRGVTERRVGDLDGIFEITGLVPPCVLLCDDVLTSGATMDAAARTLKEAGAQIVWGLTLARADH